MAVKTSQDLYVFINMIEISLKMFSNIKLHIYIKKELKISRLSVELHICYTFIFPCPSESFLRHFTTTKYVLIEKKWKMNQP